MVLKYFTLITPKEEAKKNKQTNLVDVLKSAIVTVPFGTGMRISH